MKILKTAAIAAAGLIALAACQPKVDTAAETKAIQIANKAWGIYYNAGDADALSNLYAEDAVMMPPNAPAAVGRAAIREFIAGDIAGAKAAGLMNNIAEASEVGFAGDLAWQNGTFSVTDASGATVDTGKYLSVLKKKDGKWLLLRDIWNSDKAPAPAPTAAPAS